MAEAIDRYGRGFVVVAPNHILYSCIFYMARQIGAIDVVCYLCIIKANTMIGVFKVCLCQVVYAGVVEKDWVRQVVGCLLGNEFMSCYCIMVEFRMQTNLE